ncbi:MAG: L-2-amino-thiazoline-4-carboxylic acid hydrolase [Anaerolineae bacterium]|nr:L-2-amino-thiazoline-4-carboxylic acid hydrolase [Anaerolineae bacterium]
MADHKEARYYLARKDELLEGFDRAAAEWEPLLRAQYGAAFAGDVLRAARVEFEGLLPQLPYIGGDDNHLTGSLIGSARCLALYRAMHARGRSAAETGKVLYDAVLALPPPPPIPPEQRLSHEVLSERRRARAARSQERRYRDDFVYAYVEGDGETFDYGYDFTQCATAILYRAQGAEAFLPYYCFLDFPKAERDGLGLSRDQVLSEGHARCAFRFREGGRAARRWPPRFASQGSPT